MREEAATPDLVEHNGRVAYFKGYADRDEASRDLGVTEDELEPIAP